MAINGCSQYLNNCTSVDQLWNPSLDGNRCDMQISDFATVVFNLLLDLTILLLPFPMLWGLQLPLRKKAVATVMLSFGLAYLRR